MPRTPTCWKCGYELVGLKVTDICPECATPVWSAPPRSNTQSDAQNSLVWGIVSLVLFFACLGPLAAFVAIPAIVYGNRAQRVQSSRLNLDQPKTVSKAGLVLGWITVFLSIAVVTVYVGFMFFGAGMFGWLFGF